MYVTSPVALVRLRHPFILAGELVLRLRYLALFPDPRLLLFVPQNIGGYKNKIKCG